MATEDINLGTAKSQDKDAEIARLREENQRLLAKRDNDERSAFGRLTAEAELRKQREAELAETKRKLAELQSKNVEASLTPAQIEALGQDGVGAVQAIIGMSVPQRGEPGQTTGELAEIKSKLAALEQMQQHNALRQAHNAGLVSWAAQSGVPNLFARLAPGGDLAEKWAAFAQQNPKAVEAHESGDTEATKAYVKLFMYENPGITQQAATPSAAGGFASLADSGQYGPQNWLADTNALDERLSTGQISREEYGKGYAEANAKLAASQKAR